MSERITPRARGQRKPRPKPQTVFRLTVAPDNQAPGILRIQTGRVCKDYFLYFAAADFGMAFKLEQFLWDGGEVYHVLIADDGDHQCDCRGNQRWSHCKHVTSLSALVKEGKLPGRARA